MRKSFTISLLLVLLSIYGWTQNYAIIGTGTSNTNGAIGSDPVDRAWEYEHFQIIYTAAELTGAGMLPGSSIVSLGFSVSESAEILADYSISLGLTTQATAIPYISAGLVTVKNPFTYFPVVQPEGSFDMISFDTPFLWDGFSNIVVNTCTGSNQTLIPYGGLRYTVQSSNAMVRNIRSENDICSSATNNGTTWRANIRFGYFPPTGCTGTPDPGNTLPSFANVCPGVNFVLTVQNFISGSGVAYDWEISPDGSNWSSTGATSGAYTTSQTSPQWYRCKVTCTGSGNMGISTPVQVGMNPFLNCYCSSGATNSTGPDIFSVTVNGSANAYDCSTIAPGPGSILNRYSNFLTLGPLFDLPKTVSVPFTIRGDNCDALAYAADGCAIWVDYNHNGNFNDPGEQVYSELVTTMEPRMIYGSFIVPSNAASGQTAMRISLVTGFFGWNLTACLSYGAGETEDYLVNISAAPTCPNPSAQTTSNITSTTALINWNNGGTETQWNVIYGPAGFDPAHAGIQVPGITTRPFILTQLTPNSAYHWYVKAVCSPTDSSILSGPASFKTPCTPYSGTLLPWTENFDNMTTIGNNIIPDCWVADSPSGTPWNSGNAGSAGQNDPCSAPNYIYVSLIPTDVDKFLITPGLTLKSGVLYDFIFNWTGDGFAGWTGQAMVNTVQNGEGATGLGNLFITPEITTSTACLSVSREFVAPANGTYYFMVRITNSIGPDHLGFDDFQVREAEVSLPVNYTVTGNVAGGVANCYNASETLTIAGEGTIFTVQSDGSAILIAGQKIICLPGTTVLQSGYLHGYISTDDQFCEQLVPAMPSGITGTVENDVNSKGLHFTVYPDPTDNNFTIELEDNEISGPVRIAVYNMTGEEVLSENMNSRKQEFHFSGQPQGIYIIRVISGDLVVTKKLVKL